MKKLTFIAVFLNGFLCASFLWTNPSYAATAPAAAAKNPAGSAGWGLKFETIKNIKTKTKAQISAKEIEARFKGAKWAGVPQNIPSKILMKPGASETVVLNFKNIGINEWRKDAKNFVSIYTSGPRYRKSALYHESWYAENQPAKLADEKVWQGRIGRFEINLKAPQEEGEYAEEFELASEDTQWIKGTRITLIIEVKKPDTPSATLILKSHQKIKAPGGEAVKLRLGFKNTGKTAWSKRSIKITELKNTILGEILPPARAANESWINESTPVETISGRVASGAVDINDFSVSAPKEPGEYKMKMALYADDAPVDGGEFELPITVTEPVQNTALGQENFGGSAVLGTEPNIRVGLFKIEEPINIVVRAPYIMKGASGAVLGELAQDAAVSLNFNPSLLEYSAVNGSFNVTSTVPLRFEPLAPDTTPGDGSNENFFEITSLEQRPSWNKSINYNKFRGTLEIRYSEKNQKTWIINELPLEQYVWGLAETSNNRAPEFQKALAIAARTYAYYHIQSGLDRNDLLASNKHKDRAYHVDATYDQVYKGLAREPSFPKFVAAARDTFGAIAHFGSDIAITPYFARSDGRTRLWSEVWGGDDSKRPWIKSAATTYDDGRTLWGHGVGMPLSDAMNRAETEGLTFDQILNYYFNGLSLMKKY